MTYGSDFTCQDCGEHHYLDCTLPSHIWNQIAGPVDVLCAKCIDKRLAAAGLQAEARFYFVGELEALKSELYPGEYSDSGEAAKRALAALRGALEGVDDLARDTLDVVVGWHRIKPNCECASKAPTYPTYRDNYHVEPCPWAVVEKALTSIYRTAAEQALATPAPADGVYLTLDEAKLVAEHLVPHNTFYSADKKRILDRVRAKLQSAC
jgi:hypothetical protein